MLVRCLVSALLVVILTLAANRAAAGAATRPAGGMQRPGVSLIFACSADNDLYRVAESCGVKARRYDTPAAAVEAAPAGAGVLILADGYPAKLTGVTEASLIQANGDPAADLLYTCNFSLLGLHEAYAATGEAQYRELEDRLAEFLVRVQVRSDAHPELDGAWFRAFDFNRWEYWGSNADAGWGAWAVEVGWTQGWICTGLALRELKLNLWDLTKASKVARHMDTSRKLMMPDDQIALPSEVKLAHAAVGKAVVAQTPPDPRYPGPGGGGLTDGLAGEADHTDPAWFGYEGDDFSATIDLGKPTAIRELAGRFLQSTTVGIYLPQRVVFEVSDDGRRFRKAGEARPDVPPARAGPLTCVVSIKDLLGENLRARYVRVRAVSVGKIPKGHPASGRKAWLFVDEVLVK